MHTLGELFRTYQDELMRDKARTTRYVCAKLFAQMLRELGDLPLDELTPDVLRQWKLQLLARLKPSSVHKYMVWLGSALRVAVDEYQWLAANPMTRVRKPPKGAGRIRFLRDDERLRLLAACRCSPNPLLYPIVMLALTTGARKEELRCLQWSQVDLETGVLRFLETKTDRPRAVPLVGETHGLLQELAQYRRPGIPWVFATWDGSRPTGLTSAWQRARAQAGLPDFKFHDLRHTFALYMAMSGASLREIADALGHQNIQQTLAYVHLLDSHTRKLVERMAQRFFSDPPEDGPQGHA